MLHTTRNWFSTRSGHLTTSPILIASDFQCDSPSKNASFSGEKLDLPAGSAGIHHVTRPLEPNLISGIP